MRMFERAMFSDSRTTEYGREVSASWTRSYDMSGSWKDTQCLSWAESVDKSFVSRAYSWSSELSQSVREPKK